MPTASQKTNNVSASRAVCKFPGCGQPAAPAEGPDARENTALGAATPAYQHGGNDAGLPPRKTAPRSAADAASPVTMARMTGAELLRSLRAEADRLAALGTDLRDRIDTLADPTAAEQRAQAAETDRDTAVAKVRADAEARIAAAGTERDAELAGELGQMLAAGVVFQQEHDVPATFGPDAQPVRVRRGPVVPGGTVQVDAGG